MTKRQKRRAFTSIDLHGCVLFVCLFVYCLFPFVLYVEQATSVRKVSIKIVKEIMGKKNQRKD